MESASFYGDICVDDIAIFDNATPPSAATLLAPTDGETGVPMTGQVSWMLAQGASGYFVSIGTDNPPTDVYDMADAGNNLFFDYAGLTSGTMYYWQVFPYNPNGTAPNSPVWSFTTFNDIPNAAILVSPAIGATYQNVFPTLVWASGGNFPDGYKLNLGTDNPPTDVYTNEDLGFVHTYVCPIELNIQTTYYWQIVPYNFVGDATNCPVWNFTTAPAGLVVVGNGIIEGQPLPIEPFYGYSYSQTIYLQTELNVQNQRIESILYHYDGAGTLSNEYEWVIYMGHTTETQFASTTSWLPITGFTEVFNATIPPPTGEGWIEFILDTPFVYNNTDNLVVAVEENQQAYGSSAEDFYCSAVSTPRSIYYYNDSTNPDPAAPPAAQGTPLFIPNTMFYFDELPIGPELFYRPLSQDYGTVFTNTQTPPVTFTIQNSGTGDLIINSLALGDATDFVLTDTNVYPLSLATAQTATFDVAFAPTNEGPLSTTIAITDDANVVSNIPLSGVGFNQTVSVYPYSENFDSGALPIGWEQGTDDAGDWAFGATTSSVDTGPQAGDHTSGTGMFAFTEASGFTNTRFDMISPPLDVTSLTNPFMTIWYNMYGSTMGTFHFDIWDGTQWAEDVFPEISGDQGQDWHFLDISLGGYGDIIQVRMRGVTGDNYYSDISFDDFSVWDNNQPPAATTLAAPTDGETGVAMTGAISWIPTAAASGYYVSMGTDNPPTDVYDVEDAGNTLSFDYAGLQPGVTYYWVITPYNPIGQGTSSPIWSFTSFNDIPNAATLVYPADGAMNSYVTMDLEWASGGNFPDGYRVYLGTSNPPNSVLDGLDVGFTNSYTIATPLQYSTQYYWQIIPYNFVGDATGCPLWTFTTHPAGMVILGDETLVDKHLPIEPYYGYSYSQSIHTLQEIGTPGFITSVSFYYNGGGTLSNSTQWVLYLGLTNQNEFTDGSSWVPIADLAEVWNGTVTAPAGAGWLDFPLPEDSWFLYDGSQNLVVAVEENQAAYGSSAEEFYCSARPNNRSIYYYSDGTNPDPSAPPVGTPLAFIPNTRLFTLPTGQNPYPIITPSSLNFGFVDVGAASDTRTITIRNVGQDSLLIDVTIALQGDDPGEFILADNNTYPIQVNYLETVDIDVTFMPSTEGWMNAEIVIIDNAPEGDRTTRPRQTHTLPISGRGYNLDNNDNPWQATQVSLNLEDYEEMIFPENETDWYSFWQTAPASVQMFTEAINGSQLDTYMCFYGPYDSPAQNFSDQMFIMADDDAHGNEQPEINMQITDSGFYYIRISHFSNVPAGMRPFKKRTEETRATTGEYSLTIISDNLVPPEDYLPPTNLAIESLYEAIEVTWGPPVIPDRSLAGYNVYRDDVIINTETVNSTIFLDYNVVIDETYEYKVSTVYEAPPGESVACDTVLHVHISVDAPIISDSFETYDDFATDFYPWTCMDVDGEATYGFNNGIDFPGENDAMAYIVFNPAGSTPPLQFAEAYNGDKFAACFSADSGSNDDWLITPHLQLGDNATGLNFWARSYTTQYGPEQLEVAISTTGNDPANFTPISGTEMISVPLEWTYYEFDLTNYAGDLIYVGFHCTSTQTFFLMLDEIKVISDGGTVDNHEQEIIPGNTELFSNYPNPFNPETTISFDLKQNERVSIDIYNIKGQKVKSLTNENYNAGRNHVVWTGTDSYNRKVSSGIYFFKMKAGTYTKTKKMILMK
ncbi:MAG: choice-of-anchor D domain-containing protein [Candidatus Zophobacter franzmannii]|nr:choice-of-anchor D domain-containing protein [Candidatus Zophobacter franzmannii]